MSELHIPSDGEPSPASPVAPPPGRGRRRLASGIGAAMLGLAGASVAGGAIDVSVGAADWAADDAVAQENMFNAAAPAGTRYVMVPVTVSNHDVDAIAPRTAITVLYRAEDGRTFAPERQVVPRDLDEIAPLAPGETATGNVLFAIPEDARGPGAWVVELDSDTGEELSFTAL